MARRSTAIKAHAGEARDLVQDFFELLFERLLLLPNDEAEQLLLEAELRDLSRQATTCEKTPRGAVLAFAWAHAVVALFNFLRGCTPLCAWVRVCPCLCLCLSF